LAEGNSKEESDDKSKGEEKSGSKDNADSKVSKDNVDSKDSKDNVNEAKKNEDKKNEDESRLQAILDENSNDDDNTVPLTQTDPHTGGLVSNSDLGFQVLILKLNLESY
jgi:hypothetical protein